MVAFANHPCAVQVNTRSFCQLAHCKSRNRRFVTVLSRSGCFLGVRAEFITNEKEVFHCEYQSQPLSQMPKVSDPLLRESYNYIAL